MQSPTLHSSIITESHVQYRELEYSMVSQQLMDTKQPILTSVFEVSNHKLYTNLLKRPPSLHVGL